MSSSKPDMMILDSYPIIDFDAFSRGICDKIFIHCYVVFSPVAELTDCLKPLHERAPRSHVASAACEEPRATSTLGSEWRSDSELVIDSRAPLFLDVYDGPGWSNISHGTSINLIDCVKDVKLGMDPNFQDLTYPEGRDKNSLSTVVRELSHLTQLPHLPRLQLNF